MSIVHYTCAHSIDAIHSQGLVSPTPQPVLGNRLMSWWTDITWPTTRESLGLTSHLLSCDRMQYRVEAEDTSQIVPWTKLAHDIPWDVRRFLEGPGTLPAHWFVRSTDASASGSASASARMISALPLTTHSGSGHQTRLVVTSPPYFGLRSYQDNGQHYAGQIGDEATPAEFVDALIAATAEMVRVLKPEGSIWVNLGDRYNAYNGNRGNGQIQDNGPRPSLPTGSGLDVKDIRPKSLLGIPWRYAIRCIDELGLILRAEVNWSKPNGLPESVTDRVRRSHETWFHLTKSPRYFSAVDEIREAHATVLPGTKSTGGRGYESHMSGMMNGAAHPLGKLPGSVWTIPTQPLIVPEHLGVDHFAAFPMEWPRRIIRGWSPSGICVECGQGRRPVTRVERDGDCTERRDSDRGFGVAQGQNRNAGTFTITGYACACDQPTADTTPAIVLDPFGGTGTTATVAKALGRHGISVDLSADYCRLAEWRTNDPDQLAKAAEQPKPVKVPDGQEVLFA